MIIVISEGGGSCIKGMSVGRKRNVVVKRTEEDCGDEKERSDVNLSSLLKGKGN